MNLKFCFLDWSDEWCEEVVGQYFCYVICSYVECSVQWFGLEKKFVKLIQVDSVVDFIDFDLLLMLFFGLYFVGIEVGLIWFNCLLYCCCGLLYQLFLNVVFEEEVKKVCRCFDVEMVGCVDSVCVVLCWLCDCKLVMFGVDMDYGLCNLMFVLFFGVLVCMLMVVGWFVKMGCVQVVLFIGEVLLNYKGYCLKVFKLWDYYLIGDDDFDVWWMNEFFEEQILLMFEQYYWVYKCFKMCLFGELSLY